MLKIKVPGEERYNEETEEFSYGKVTVLELEHSLLSVSKWESIHKTPFLNKSDFTPEELIGYIKCMTLNKVDPKCYDRLTLDNFNDIKNYLSDPMTATTFYEAKSAKNRPSFGRQTITSELIYYWLAAFQIPFTCETWNLNRLLTLCRIASIKNDPKANKMSKREALAQQRAINEQRQAALRTHG